MSISRTFGTALTVGHLHSQSSEKLLRRFAVNCAGHILNQLLSCLLRLARSLPRTIRSLVARQAPKTGTTCVSTQTEQNISGWIQREHTSSRLLQKPPLDTLLDTRLHKTTYNYLYSIVTTYHLHLKGKEIRVHKVKLVFQQDSVVDSDIPRVVGNARQKGKSQPYKLSAQRSTRMCSHSSCCNGSVALPLHVGKM